MKAVIPIAGLGTRFLPVTKSVPKEMLPIVDKPVIQYLIEEAAQAGIDEVIMVINDNNEITRKYFTPDPVFEKTIKDKGRSNLTESLQELLNKIKFTYVRQEQPLGDGHAILQAKEAVGNEPFLVLFGDDIIDNEISAAKQLIETFQQKNCSIIALEKIPPEKTKSYGVIAPKSSEGRLHEIESLVEKPEPENAPSNLGIIGKYVCTPEIWQHLETAESSHRGEIRLIDGFRSLINEQPIYGLEIQGQRFDTGTPNGLLGASTHFASKQD
ncbi:MAG: UTP--glucose-1-phosphate uridylyltransferase [Patescibacteria group bacterium]|nr:UTP--glucose-1-phosphate uridylyltransferase [Patescibacteria group bacterium]